MMIIMIAIFLRRKMQQKRITPIQLIKLKEAIMKKNKFKHLSNLPDFIKPDSRNLEILKERDADCNFQPFNKDSDIGEMIGKLVVGLGLVSLSVVLQYCMDLVL